MKQLLKTEWTCLLTAISDKLHYLFAMLIAFFAPIQGIMLTVGFLILMDTIFGIWKAKKLKEKITSRGLSRIISKMFLYEGAIIGFFLIDKYILGDILFRLFSVEFLLTKLVGLVLASVEVFSIDENYRAVNKFGLWHAAKKLLARTREVKDELKDFDLDKFK